MSDKPDICANCGKVYERHSEQTYCGPGESKWFPKKLADAITEAESGRLTSKNSEPSRPPKS